MFQKDELKRLQERKALLVLQSDANRLLLTADWQQLRSPDTWMNEAASLARRHPVWVTALATAAGVLAVNVVRRPGSVMGGVGRLGQLASAAFSIWKLIRGRKSEE